MAKKGWIIALIVVVLASVLYFGSSSFSILGTGGSCDSVPFKTDTGQTFTTRAEAQSYLAGQGVQLTEAQAAQLLQERAGQVYIEQCVEEVQ